MRIFRICLRTWLHALAAVSTLAGSIALAQVCATPEQNASTPSISGVINSYYPGTGSNVSIGSTSIPLGGIDTSGGGATTAIAAGDLLIVMQMQGAEINFSNSDCYGDGAGSADCATATPTRTVTAASYAGGNLASNYRAGIWEYCTATAAAGANVSVVCGGASGGTVNSYQASTATSSVGAYRYQVVRVPQYGNVSLTGNVQPAPWNGSTGGVLGMQATGAVTMAGFNLDASERGFRGGGQTFLGNYGTSLLDPINGSFFYTAVAGTITGAAPGGEREGSFKGEGVAGTPRLVYNGITQTGVVTDDYPGGSRARGAPGNAGGGGNNQNGGGGGAGGSILVASSGSLAGRSLDANGGNGANSSYDRHGPGGGAGGGVVYFNAAGAPTVNAAAGIRGVDAGNLGAGPLGDGVAEPWFATSGSGNSLGNGTPLTIACSTALAVSKTNGTDTLVAGSTTNYTVTFSNAGPTAANNAVAKDVASAGLSNCTATACSGSGSPIAVCPAPASWPNLFTPGGLILTSLPPNSSLTFNVSCGVTATGQ